MNIQPGDIVKFTDPSKEEEAIRMRVLEVNGDRLLVEDVDELEGLKIHPTCIISINDVVKA